MIPQLYRKRLIPNEIVKLCNDEIVYYEKNIIVTKWKPIKPRKDIGSGQSCYLIDKNIKVSRFYDCEGNFTYWYCDIIETSYNAETNEYVFTDMLADVKAYENGTVEALDIEELADALEDGSISVNQLKSALRALAALLNIAYEGKLYELCGKYLDFAAEAPSSLCAGLPT